jgi:hypothetical protein
LAYQTGVPTGCANFLGTLATAATSAGWTVDHNAAVTSDGYWLALHNATGCYVDLHALAADNQINIYGATGYNGSNSYNAQPGNGPVSLPAITGSGASFLGYHIFTQAGGASPYIHCILEVTSGVFVHIHFGTIVSTNGGGNVNYVGCSSTVSPNGTPYNSYPQFQTTPWADNTFDGMMINATVDGTNHWFRSQNIVGTPTRALFPFVNPVNPSLGKQLYFAAVKSQPNTFNGLPVLLPMPIMLERASGNLWAYVGDALDIRQYNLQSNSPKDEITIGSDVWKVFPVITKGSATNVYNGALCSGMVGFAFRKNA